MSTKFGVHYKNQNIELIDDCLSSEYYDYEDTFELVAFRSSKFMTWTNPIAKFLPPETKVYPLDNSAQGIYTIGDIIKVIEDESK